MNSIYLFILYNYIVNSNIELINYYLLKNLFHLYIQKYNNNYLKIINENRIK